MTNSRVSREARLQELADADAAARRKRVGLIAGALIAVLALVGGGVAWWMSRSGAKESATTQARAQHYLDLSRDHVSGQVDYPQDPPVGGEHWQVWQNCGIYSEPIPNETGVHSLEHGAYWITYRPGLATDQLDKLKADVEGKTYGLLSPYKDLSAPIVITSWGVQLKLQSADDPALQSFIADYGDGKKAPEPGAACTGGVGKPDA